LKLADEKVLITESTLDNIGEAIREKNGESDLYYPNQMPAAIRRIQTGGGGSGSVVAVFPVLLSGEHIADIVVDGDRFALYAPEPIEYTPGTGIEISQSGVVSVSEALRTTISGKAEQTALDNAVAALTASVASKQNLLIPGDGITITGNTISATEVEANPQGTPTDELNTIRIGSDIFEIVGGGSGGSGYTATMLYDGTEASSLQSQITLSDSWKNYDALYFEGMFNGEAHFGNIIPKETLQRSIGMYVGALSFSSSYIGLNTLNNDGVTLSFYGQNVNKVTAVYGLKYGSGGSSGGGSYSEEIIFTGTNSDSSPITLLKDINGFDLLEFVVAYTDHKTTGSFQIPVKYFVDHYQYSQFSSIASTDNLTITLAGSEWFRIARGQTDTQLQFMKGNNFYLKSVIGIKTGGSGGGGASAVSDLTDVSLSSLANGQILKWNSTTQKWENANESGGGSSLPFDVVINSNDNGIDIVYDDGT
jgi:hypothetical protein